MAVATTPLGLSLGFALQKIAWQFSADTRNEDRFLEGIL
jgi:hypothetical protein